MIAVGTTIEIKPEHLVRMVELAALRGEKGFSAVIAEALDLYFREVSVKERARQSALRLRGVFSAAEAERFRNQVKMLRKSWVRGLRLA